MNQKADNSLPPTNARAHAVSLARETGRNTLERFPSAYLSLARRRNHEPRRPLLSETTDLVIEGFPRSGNSHLLSWIAVSNPTTEVASHAHTIAHVRAALRQGVPTVVLLRAPQDAIPSEMVRASARGSSITPAMLLKRYERFYQGVRKVAGDVILSPFEVTTQRTQAVLNALVERYNLPLDLTPPSSDDVTTEIERLNRIHAGGANEMTVARPSERRKEAIEAVRVHLHDHHGKTLARLQELHARLQAHSSTLSTD